MGPGEKRRGKSPSKQERSFPHPSAEQKQTLKPKSVSGLRLTPGLAISVDGS